MTGAEHYARAAQLLASSPGYSETTQEYAARVTAEATAALAHATLAGVALRIVSTPAPPSGPATTAPDRHPVFRPGMMVGPIDADDTRFWFVKEADGAVVFCPPVGPNQFARQMPPLAALRVLWAPEYDQTDTR